MRVAFRTLPPRRVPAHTFYRGLWNSSSQKATAAVEADVESSEDQELREHIAQQEAQFANAPQHGTVLYNWGMYPFYGLLGTTIISKELFIMDNNFPAVGLFGAFFLAMTWVAGPAMHSHFNAEKLAKEQDKHNTFDLIFALLDRTSDQIKAFGQQPKVLNEFVAEYQQSVNDLAHAEVRKLQFEAYAKTLSELQTLANLKSAEAGAQANLAEDVLTKYMFAAFEADAKLLDQTVEEAIDNLGGVPKPAKAEGDESPDSIVAGVFQEYIESGQFDVDRMVAVQEAAEAAAAKKR
jgi:hypothetical protein